MNPTESQECRFRANAATRSYVVLGLCFGYPAALAVGMIVMRPELLLNLLPLFLGSVLLVAFMFAWLRAFRIEITDSQLVYRTLFLGEVALQLAEVTCVKRVVDYNPWRNWGAPRNRLEVFSVSNRAVASLRINLQIFRSDDVGYLVRFFESAGKSSQPDESRS